MLSLARLTVSFFSLALLACSVRPSSIEVKTSSKLELDAELSKLKSAVEHEDWDSVARISRSLQEEADHRRHKEEGDVGAARLSQSNSKCILDDQVFSLTEESKTELATELENPSMQEALKWMRNTGGDDFHLQKRLTSKSYLQEAWIFLLRLLGHTKLLPLGTGDRVHHGMENWFARAVPGTTPVVLERLWIDRYMKDVVAASHLGPRCLEWGNPGSPGNSFYYAAMVPTCQNKFDMQFDSVFYGRKPMSLEGNVVYSDIDNLPSVLTSNGDHRMDVILATQVFEHVANPADASKRLYEALLPGGVLVFTAPQQSQFHLVPHDYFRYTKEGVLNLLTTAGFCVPDWSFVGGGDFVFDIARDAGLQGQDFALEEIQSGFQQGFSSVSDSAITMHAMGFKPPHEACSQAMAQITPSQSQRTS